MSGVEGRKPRQKRAERKRQRKRFAVGDCVTWGYRFVAERVVEVGEHGLYVDDSGGATRSARYFVPWSDAPEKVDLAEFAGGKLGYTLSHYGPWWRPGYKP